MSTTKKRKTNDDEAAAGEQELSPMVGTSPKKIKKSDRSKLHRTLNMDFIRDKEFLFHHLLAQINEDYQDRLLNVTLSSVSFDRRTSELCP
jgi:hypothetical protein